MDALPLAGNLSVYELFRGLVPDTALGAMAVVIATGLFLALVAAWLWFWSSSEQMVGHAAANEDHGKSR